MGAFYPSIYKNLPALMLKPVPYLYTVALTNLMGHNWGQIYLHIATKTYRRWGKHEMAGDIIMDSITDYQMAQLNRFKD